MKLGVVANEFFDLRAGRLGGFGWAARAVADCFAARPELGVEAVLISALPRDRSWNGHAAENVHGPRLLHAPTARPELRRLLRREEIDLLLTIDYRRQYRRILLGYRPIVRPGDGIRRLLSASRPHLVRHEAASG